MERVDDQSRPVERIESTWDERIEREAASLMGPRDRNGRPLDAAEAERGETQLVESVGRSSPPVTGDEANRAVEADATAPANQRHDR